MEEEGPQSSFMFLVTCNEAFGYSEDTSIKEEDGEWVEMVDFDTGHVKRIKKVLSA